ncbi:MAG: glycosyltransferase family 39 protein [Magnetovibrio sp.]|nr:glycosyltransferase family 39 protein [Magnetovibrio sp.]
MALRTLNTFDKLSVGVLAGTLLWIVLGFQTPGQAWDDHFQSIYGDMILAYFSSGFDDQRALTYNNLPLYGGLFDTIAQAFVRILPFAPQDTRHLLTSLTGLVGLIGVWRFGRYLGGATVGFLALVLLVTTPSYVGHMFINAKDIPFAAAYIWALYLAVLSFEQFPEVKLTTAVWLGVALGCAMGVRIGGVLVVAYLGVLLAQHYLWRHARSPISGRIPEVASIARTLFLVAIPAFILTFALWPRSWEAPLHLMLFSLLQTSNFDFVIDVLLAGNTYPSNQIPWFYWPLSFGVKLPEILLLGLVISVPWAVIAWTKAIRAGDRKLGFGLMVLMLGAFFPPLYSVLSGAVHYDGIRHFLFVVPPMGVLVALGLTWIKPSKFVIVAISVGVAISGARIITSFPYTYVVYNMYAGGTDGVQGRYELDYWAVSYKDAAHALTKLRQGDEGAYTVFVCGPQPSAEPYLDQYATIVQTLDQADYLLCFTRWNANQAVQAPIIATIATQGAVLSEVKDLRRGYTLQNLPPKTLTLIQGPQK